MIRAFKNLYRLIKELYSDRRLLVSLSKKDFRRKFAGSYLGVIWAFLQPALTVLVYCIVFQFAFPGSNTDGVPFVAWFLPGIVLWLFISEAISISSSAYLEYSYLVKKVAFSIGILPMVKVLSSFITHLCFVVLVEAILMAYGIFPTLFFLQFPYYSICTLVFVYAFALLLSSIMVFFRDLGQIISLLLLVGMWGTPIAWHMGILSKTAQKVLSLNPVYYLVEGYRDSFLGRGWFTEKPELTFLFWSVSCVLLLIGANLYRRLKPHFADVL